MADYVDPVYIPSSRKYYAEPGAFPDRGPLYIGVNTQLDEIPTSPVVHEGQQSQPEARVEEVSETVIEETPASVEISPEVDGPKPVVEAVAQEPEIGPEPTKDKPGSRRRKG